MYTGREALILLDNTDFDLAIVDLYMPGLDGLEVLQAIRQKGLEVHTILMTGYASRKGSLQKAVQAMKLGAVEFLTKPFDVDDLIAIIHRLLKYRPSSHVLAERLEAYVKQHACDATLRFRRALHSPARR